ncbi:SHOCT domain-containing protein [Geothrix fuzhouensis]|uniref:SHOCT domain-containing protein n=1 Tax=Geothrix fuzhouensis TaxID=2966451 RepID=UPI0021489D27|nr:SHOCT domain-containing protein [Geothrix fuzhouensis]
MRWSPAAFLIALPIAVMVGCTKPDLDFGKLRIGMDKKEVIARAGQPTRASVVQGFELFEYEAYDRYGALKVNERSSFVRFANGRVDALGTREEVDPAKVPAAKVPAEPKAGDGPGTTPASSRSAGPAPAPFDLRTELEKLDKLKKDGLISEAEFQDLRQRVLEKAKAQ